MDGRCSQAVSTFVARLRQMPPLTALRCDFPTRAITHELLQRGRPLRQWPSGASLQLEPCCTCSSTVLCTAGLALRGPLPWGRSRRAVSMWASVSVFVSVSVSVSVSVPEQPSPLPSSPCWLAGTRRERTTLDYPSQQRSGRGFVMTLHYSAIEAPASSTAWHYCTVCTARWHD